MTRFLYRAREGELEAVLMFKKCTTGSRRRVRSDKRVRLFAPPETTATGRPGERHYAYGNPRSSPLGPVQVDMPRLRLP